MLNVVTICLDGMPFIERHLSIFEQLKSDWHWYIVHGAANNGGSTSWCQPQRGRLSEDGTTEYLVSIKDNPNVTVIEKKLWPSKDDQVNAALEKIKEPCVLIQVDSDEIWAASQLETIVRIFEQRPQLSSIMFACRYYVGERLIVQGTNCFSDYPYEWLRAWRFEPGMTFLSHEPPLLDGTMTEYRMSKEESRKLGLIFDHHAYALESQVDYKSRFYGYGSGLVEAWRKLQEHDNFPTNLNRFFSFLPAAETAKVVRV